VCYEIRIGYNLVLKMKLISPVEKPPGLLPSPYAMRLNLFL
jgi:hypothetical protein